jgi:hypothetical protein
MFGVWRRFVGSGRGVIAFALFIGVLVCCDEPGFAQAQTERVTVISNAPIYLLPDSARAPLRTAAAGTVLEVVTDEGPWIQVRFQDPQFGVRVGYVESRFIRRAAQQPELRPLDLSVPQSRSALAPVPASQPPASRPPGDVPNGSDGDALDAGSTEIMALGSLTGASVEGEIATEALLQVFTGVFASRHLEFGATVTGYKITGFDMLGAAGGIAVVNFPNNSRFFPFVGGGVGKGFGYSSLVGNPWYIDVEGGFRILTPRRGGALIIRPFYQRQFFSGVLGDSDLNLFGVALGASVMF